LVWDPLLQGLLLFGGLGPRGLLNDTWLYQRTVGWTELYTPVAPPPRQRASFAYDPVDGEALLFGGQGAGGVPLGDTWTYGPQGWVELHPNPSPSPRFGAGLVYDQGAGRLYLFGGEGSGGPLSDTWWFRGGLWRSVPTSRSPPARTGELMVATGDGTPLIFGGQGANGWLNDTWAFLNGTWQPVTYEYGTSPPPVQGASLVADPEVGPDFFTMLGGYEGGGAPSIATWTLYVPFGGVSNSTTPLTVSLTSSQSQGTAPLTVSFQATLTGGQPPYSFDWSFGDGQTASGSAAEVHTYSRPGDFVVRVEATDAAGVVVGAKATIAVEAPPGPNPFSYLGGPAVWALLGVTLVLVAWGGSRAVRQGLLSSRLRRAVGTSPSRIRRTAEILGTTSPLRTPSRTLRALEEVWWPRDWLHQPRRGPSPFLRWLARRLLLLVPQILLATTLLWILSEVLPSAIAGTPLGGIFQSWAGLNGALFTGHWGYVGKYNEVGVPEAFAPVSELLGFYLRDSLELAFFSLLFATLLSYPLGLLSGWRPGRPLDHATRTLAAFGAFFSLAALVLILTTAVYSPFVHLLGDSPYGTLPSNLWFETHLGSIPSWVSPLGGTNPTGFPLVDALLAGSWSAAGLISLKLAFQGFIIGLSFSALFLRYARLGAAGQRGNFHLTVSRARGVPEGRLLWHDTSRLVLPVYIYTFGNTFAVFLLIQTFVEWFVNDNGFGSFLVEAVFGQTFSLYGPPLISVLAFLFLIAVFGVNVLADAISRLLDPRTANLSGSWRR
jgi:ABC-type dipeptide/oligopeptide/nickel transport system permease component